MPLIATHELSQNSPLSKFDHDQVYNGLDCCVTFEVLEKLHAIPHPSPITYDFSRAMQAPALEMMLRGMKINTHKRNEWEKTLSQRLEKLEKILNAFAYAIWEKDLNANSPKQLIEFFYTCMRLPIQWSFKKGQKKISTDRNALEKLAQYFYARPIISTISKIRDTKKQLSIITTEIDKDSRWRSSYNIVGTETGRWSSSKGSNGTASNTQNITGELREIFVSDPGWKICAVDLEQAESREVGWTLGVKCKDWRYLDAAYAGDLHTITARMVWKDLGWDGGFDKKSLTGDREIAERPFYRHFSYRDMSKRGGHGVSYYGTPRTMAMHLKVPVELMEDFQKQFFSAYGHDKWHLWVKQQLQTTHTIKNVFGMERVFFGRTDDDTTLREAIAHGPQSSTGVRLNLALWRVWFHLRGKIRLWAQVHDALYFLYREADEMEVVPKALSLIQVDIPEVDGHRLIVPGEAKIGWNWGTAQFDKEGKITGNPFGLVKFKNTPDLRKPPEEVQILQRIVL